MHDRLLDLDEKVSCVISMFLFGCDVRFFQFPYPLMTATLLHAGNRTLCDASDVVCDNGFCIDSLAECNGFDDCLDNSDEIGCGKTMDGISQDLVDLKNRHINN